MSANLESSDEQTNGIDDRTIDLKKTDFDDASELKDIIDDLKKDLNKFEVSKHQEISQERNQERNQEKSQHKSEESKYPIDRFRVSDESTNNMNSMNIFMNKSMNAKMLKVKSRAPEAPKRHSIHQMNNDLNESINVESSSDLESFVIRNQSDKLINQPLHQLSHQPTSQQNSISDHDDRDDFDIIDQTDCNFDSQPNSNQDLKSNVDSNFDSNFSSSINLNSENYSNASLTHDSIEQNPLKRDSQILSQSFKENVMKSKANKLFHHKSTEQVDQKKQTWQKQLLQTPFFKSFNTQQLLSNYGNHQQIKYIELPDKIMITDDDDDEPLLSGSGNVSKECSDELIQLWSNILAKWKKPNQRPAGLKDLIKYGIPQSLRGQVWQLLVEGDDDDEIIDKYRRLITKESAFQLNIERDINRTFPANEYFRNSNSLGQDNLFKLCKAYSIHDEELGYCQGLTYIGAALLLHLPEEQSFVVLVRIMEDYGVRNLFRSAFENLHLRFYQLDRLMEEQLPELYQHFNQLGIETHMFASQWMLTLFTAKFPLHLVFYILDLFLYNKFNTIFQVSIALLQLSASELLKLDFEGVLKYFRVYLPKKYRTDANAKFLLKTAFNVKVKKLDKYEKDYLQFKEAQQDPVQRLTKENQRLQSSVMRLEQENDNLAHEISMSKLTMRAQLDMSEDRCDQLSGELKRQNKYLSELEDEKRELHVQVSKLKELCRRELETVETKADQNEKISNQYKEIVSKLSRRLEEQEKVNNELKSKISNCTKCSQLIEENTDDSSSGGASIMESFRKNSSEEYDRIKELETRIHELEIELASTKLELVESKCNNQALQHQLNSRN